MTNEERDLITQFVARTGGRPASSGFAASVPQVGGPELPPVEPQADALIADLFARYPEARYRITQLAFVQEHALAAATNQIQLLQAQMQQMQAQMQQMQQMQQQQQPQQQAPSPWGPAAQPQPQQSRGFFGGLFGGGQAAPQAQPQPQPQYAPQYAAPPPQYAPGYQPGMFQRPGSGFLGSALTTAAGVAGGIMAADALTGLFAGHHQAQAASFGGGGFGQPAGYFPPDSASPWGGSPQGADPFDQGGASKSYGDSAWAPAPAQDSGWQDAGQSQDSGWQDASAGDSGWTDSGGGDSDS